MNNQSPAIHLLWPPGEAPGAEATAPRTWSEHAVADLGLDELAQALTGGPRHQPAFRKILLQPCDSPPAIHYRQEVLQDCLANPALVAGLEELMPRLTELAYLRDYSFTTLMEQVVNRLGELETYVDVVHQLSALLDGQEVQIQSNGLRQLRGFLHAQANQSVFHTLVEELPELRRKAARVVSITVGVNLDNQLRPVSAALLSFNERPITGLRDTFLSRLLGSNREGDTSGIAPLHSVPRENSSLVGAPGRAGQPQGSRQPNPLMFPLFRDLDEILKRAMEPVAAALQAFVSVNSSGLVELEHEIAFFIGAVRMIERMRAAGLPMCQPEAAPAEERVSRVEGLYNLLLAERTLAAQPDQPPEIVVNALCFDDQARIYILTGPNQGGKTTYTQAVGIMQVLFQAGLYVPGESARVSPVDSIFTHFPLEERPETGTGRLGEEAQRISEIFQHATTHSLVLLNESLSATSPGESIYLARDIVRALRLWGLRAIFVTHLHELAENLSALNDETPGDSPVASLVAGLATADGRAPHNSGEPARRTYKIVPAPPMGLSFARDIAHRHGISFDQLAEVRRSRQKPTR